MLTRLTLAFALAASTATAQGLSDPEGEAVFEALGLAEMIDVMREEGIVYGAEIGDDLFEGRVTGEWTTLVSDIYDADRMSGQVQAVLQAEIEPQHYDDIIAFFTNETGQTVISLEIAARRALLDEAVEEAATEAAALASADETDRYKLVEKFVATNDLIETNIVGALNSNYAFYTGLADGGALGNQLTEEQILADVWSQEPEIRQNTTEWVYSFLLLSYQPLEDGELVAYIAFSETDAGQDLNQAMFTAFDGVFESISRALGLGSARFMVSEDI